MIQKKIIKDMKIGKFNLLFFFIFFILFNISFIKADDKIESVPLINLEEL